MDPINREDAIDALKTAYWNKEMQSARNDPCIVDAMTDWAIRQIKSLPSAQPESIQINLNERIKVKLTNWGKEIYYHQYDRINQIAGKKIIEPRFPKEDENGYTEFQLWCFIELYGEHIGITLPNVIEPLEIVYKRRTDE